MLVILKGSKVSIYIFLGFLYLLLTLAWNTKIVKFGVIIFYQYPEMKVYILLTELMVNIAEHPPCSLQDPGGYYKLL